MELNEHGGYTVTVPGLVTEGKDLNHARAMAKDAVRCYIEGLKKSKEPIPLERESAQIKISVVTWTGPKNHTVAEDASVMRPKIQRLAHPSRRHRYDEVVASVAVEDQ